MAVGRSLRWILAGGCHLESPSSRKLVWPSVTGLRLDCGAGVMRQRCGLSGNHFTGVGRPLRVTLTISQSGAAAAPGKPLRYPAEQESEHAAADPSTGTGEPAGRPPAIDNWRWLLGAHNGCT